MMTTTRIDAKGLAARLLKYLRQFKNDRGAMANLRCALSPTRRARAWPLLAPVSGIDRPIYETLAGLFAYHPDETRGGNLGTTCLRLKGQNESFDGRFRRLLTCDREEICERLRPVVLAARAKGIPINYEQLFVDLHWRESAKVRWAREYWGAVQPGETADIATIGAAP